MGFLRPLLASLINPRLFQELPRQRPSQEGRKTTSPSKFPNPHGLVVFTARNQEKKNIQAPLPQEHTAHLTIAQTQGINQDSYQDIVFWPALARLRSLLADSERLLVVSTVTFITSMRPRQFDRVSFTCLCLLASLCASD